MAYLFLLVVLGDRLMRRWKNAVPQFRIPALIVAVCATAFFSGCGSSGPRSSGGSGGSGTSTGSYSLSLSASSLTLSTSDQTLTVTLQPVGGFNSSVNCLVSGLPAGLIASPNDFALSGTGSQQITFSIGSGAVAGTSTVTINSTGGGVSKSASFQLTLNPPPPGISLSLQPSSLSLIPGVQQQVQVAAAGVGGYSGMVNGTVTALPSGVSVSYSTFSMETGTIANLYFTAASGAASGNIGITATSGSFSATAQLPVSINSTRGFQVTTSTNGYLVLSQNASETFTVSATPYNGFNQPISVSLAGAPSGVTFSPASFTLQPGTSQTVTLSSTFSAATTNDASITVTGVAGTISEQVQLSLSITAPALSVSVQPSTLAIPAGASDTFQVQLTSGSVGTPLSDITVSLGAAPSGVTFSPSTYTFSGGGGVQSIFVEAASGAKGGSATVNASYGPVQASASINLTIGSANNFPPVALSTPDQLVRFDTLTPYLSFPEPNYLLYHSATNRFFSTDAFLNRLYVIDAANRTLTATLTIPGAFGIDQAPDGSVIYVGTMVGDLYVVDPVNLTILQRYASSTISPYGFLANAVYALADGKLILEQYNLLPVFSWVDGNGSLALWDPKTNDITEFIGTSSLNANGAIPQEPSCLQNFEQVILTNNRTRVLLVPASTSQGSAVLCSLDPEADTWNWSQQITGGAGSVLATFAISSDGNTLAAFDGYDIYSLDPATFAVKSSFPVPVRQGLLIYPVMLLSQDNQSIFITDPNGADVFDEYNFATGKLTGWISQLNLASPESYTPIQPFYQAMASNGLAAGVIEGGGIGLLDTTAVHAPPIGSRFTQTQLSVPYGPTGGGTAESWLPSYTAGPNPPPLGSVYFGTNTASDVNNDGFDAYIDAVTPAGNAGVVDVRTFATDGGSQLMPDGFSYGPSVLEAPTTYSTAEGGGSGDLFGYGFGPQALTNSQLYIAPPSDLQVTLGGASATLTDYSPNPYVSTYFTAPVFPSNALQYTIPPGTAGATSAIAVSNSSGTTTATQAMNYLPAVQQYPVSGQLADGVYDPVRDVYYFTDATQIRVFSLAQGAWLPSIPIPAPTGAYGPQRLYSLAISPDGSKLAVSDPGAIAIYVIDLNQTSSIQSFAYASQIVEPTTREPAGVAITNNGTVYFVTFDLDGDGGSGYLYALNPSTGRIAEVTGGNLNESTYLPTQGPDPDGRLVTTEDGSRIYFNDAGLLGWIDTTTGTFLYAPYNNDSEIGQDDYEIVMGANQTRLFAEGFFDDSNFNSIGLQAINIAESLDANYVYGGAFSADGSLFFQPGTQAIDAFDGRTGAFRARIALPVLLSPNFRALVSNNQDSRLVAITGTMGNGIAVINLNSLPEPDPLPWLTSEVRQLSSARPYRPVQKIKIPPNPFVRIHRQGNSRLVRLLKEGHQRSGLPLQAKHP